MEIENQVTSREVCFLYFLNILKLNFELELILINFIFYTENSKSVFHAFAIVSKIERNERAYTQMFCVDPIKE